ncbi:YdeI/OmpD-associated family protein [Pontibacter rugosus]|uniref:YdeI/OmpD-associated family protein n=1 Tax=Pontibacter rugosus TaxID=1745966 RepID=A0ABW3SLB8_9BACT
MTELGRKLQLKAGQQLLLLCAPEEVEQLLTEEAYTIVKAEKPPADAFGAALIFVESEEELAQQVLPLLTLLKAQAILWVAYPKKSSGLKTELTRDSGWQLLTEEGFQAVRQVAINEVWSALRFTEKSERKAASTFGQDMPGIDRKAKTVAMPEDLKLALQEAKLLGVFEKMAFTHRKEYVVAVLEAKKQETRARRILKTVAKLQEKQVKV